MTCTSSSTPPPLDATSRTFAFRHSRRVRIASTAVVVIAMSAMASIAWGSAWAQPINAAMAVDRGAPELQLDGAAINATNFVPGSRIQQVMRLRNAGTGRWNHASLTVGTPDEGRAGAYDLRAQLRLRIEDCSTTWQGDPRSGMRCAGTRTVLLDAPALATRQELVGLDALDAGGTDNLLVTMELPSTVGNEVQGSATDLTIRISVT